MAPQVLLYWPNVVGVDGWLARRLGQSSRLGAWLDVVVDNLGRGMLWSLLYEWGWLVSALEWCVFVCNHSSRGERWKSSFSSSPRIIRAVMANGFQTPVGAWVVGGLHGLPVWLYLQQRGLLARCLLLPPGAQAGGALLLAGGRLLALAAEVWCIWKHVEFLSRDEPGEEPEPAAAAAAAAAARDTR
ncbi:uncharacterized protein si:ch1073-145m9.1 isoform X2 [Cololabis saira]|uniref:uncharacterized protein si:ch1073-145m9.1 isoform X2 n=1 Tax=Cololabis saira TaxID=129043 RepID=UPI002AD329D6|nr:uncharacterized protein si:ch1073-145m9.1 isoform X2 [Cololabis saira]